MRSTPKGTYVACAVHFKDEVTPRINDFAGQLFHGKPVSPRVGRGARKRVAAKGLFAGAPKPMPGLSDEEKKLRRKARAKRKALLREREAA